MNKNNVVTLRPNIVLLKITNFINKKDMKISKIEHLGIAVKSIEEALPYYENVLGLKC